MTVLDNGEFLVKCHQYKPVIEHPSPVKSESADCDKEETKGLRYVQYFVNLFKFKNITC